MFRTSSARALASRATRVLRDEVLSDKQKRKWYDKGGMLLVHNFEARQLFFSSDPSLQLCFLLCSALLQGALCDCRFA